MKARKSLQQSGKAAGENNTFTKGFVAPSTEDISSWLSAISTLGN